MLGVGRDDGDPRWIRNRFAFRKHRVAVGEALAGSEFLERDFQEARGFYVAIGERIDGDAVSGRVFLSPFGIRERSDRSIEFVALAAEGEPEPVGLLRLRSKARVRKVADRAVMDVVYGDRLVHLAEVGSVALIKDCRIATFGRDDYIDGKTIEL